MKKSFLLIFCILLLMDLFSIDAIAIDDYHCKVPTCRDFYYGLRHLPNYDNYEDTCYDTVFALQAIPRLYGKCIDEKTSQLNSSCIHALAMVMKKCLHRMKDLGEKEARYYCGYTLMKYCAVHVGLDQYPLAFH